MLNLMSNAPHFDINLAAFHRDPYPILAELRATAPIAYVPALDATLFTRRDDIFTYEKMIDVFSSLQPGGLMTRLMGENMMRKDGDAHLGERKQMFPSVSPRTVRDVWTAEFLREALKILAELRSKGACDLVTDYAMPVSAAALRAMTGLSHMSYAELDGSSQAMIDGISNHVGDPAVEARCNEGTALIDRHIDMMIDEKRATPDHSILSVLMEAGQPMQQIRANVKLAISGGQNEPRDAISGCIWALLRHPEQLFSVLAGAISWLQVFEEYARWISPIGMSPRRIAKDHAIGDIQLAAEDRAFLMFGAANRDEEHFENPDQFDLRRDASNHIAFGAGPHFCAGAWASKALVAKVALPLAFEHLPNLRLEGDEPRMRGWAFRGLENLPVAWDA